MGRFRTCARRIVVSAALIVPAGLVVVQPGPALADVATVRGSGFGFSANVALFGGAPAARGPAPTATLPAAGSAAPVTADAATGSAQYGPATIFSSGPLAVSTQGTTGATGSVTTTTTVQSVNTSGQEVFTAAGASSTCTASEAGVTGSATITGGTLVTSEGDPDVDGDETIVTVAANPAPNTVVNGSIESIGDTYRYIFNEQITNADGSITVNAAHQVLLGPTALGDLIIGQSVCGVTKVGGPVTTTSSSSTTTTAPTTTSTTAPAASGTVGGGAYGFFSNVGLFGGAPATRGPAPTVTLPSVGSATPITATAATGDARYGPGIIFTSGAITVSTEGTPGGTVKSSATVNTLNTSDQEVLTGTSAASTCTAATAGGTTGSATIAGGKVQTSEGDPDVDGDETFVDVPANPEVNKTIEGKLEGVGDTFRYVFNEQVVKDGAITVNAAHQYLLGPTGVGELIIGQSRCALSAAAFGTGGGPGGGANAAGPAGTLAATGTTTTRQLVELGLGLLIVGLAVTLLGRRPRRTGTDGR